MGSHEGEVRTGHFRTQMVGMSLFGESHFRCRPVIPGPSKRVYVFASMVTCGVKIMLLFLSRKEYFQGVNLN